MWQATLDGLAVGASYALLAIAFTLVFGVLRSINLAFGACIMLGLYAAMWARRQWGLDGLWLLPLCVLVTAAAGLYVDRLCFAPHRQRAAVTMMAASFAIWMQLEEFATALLPRHTNAFPSLFGIGEHAGEQALLRPDYLAAMACAGATAGLAWFLVHRTRWGVSLRAVADHHDAATLVGIRVERVIAWVTLLAAALGGVAGFLIASIDAQVTPMFAMWATMKGMIAALLGGLGSFGGALAGGLLLGLLEFHAQRTLGAQGREFLGYLLLLLVLWRCPGGLAGLARGSRSPAGAA